MAKKKSTIGDILKKSTPNKMTTEEIDKVAKKIVKESKAKERTKRLSVDVPIPLYVELKKKVAEEDTTIRDFVIGQIKKGI